MTFDTICSICFGFGFVISVILYIYSIFENSKLKNRLNELIQENRELKESRKDEEIIKMITELARENGDLKK